MLPQWVRGRTTAWNQRVGWSIGPGMVSTRRPAPPRPKSHCTNRILAKQTISIDAREDATQQLELAPLLEVRDETLSVMLVVRLSDVGNMEQSALCTVTLREASVTVDGTVLHGDALCSVAFDALTTTPALLVAETQTPVAEIALTLEWSQGSSTSSAQDIELAVDIVERRPPARSVSSPARVRALPVRPRKAPCDTAGNALQAPPVRHARRAVMPALRADRFGGAALYRVLDKRTFDIDGDTRELAVPLATRIPTVDYIDAVLVVRVHALTWPTEGTPTLSVRLLNESVAPEQPSLEFVDRDDVVASVDIDDSLSLPALLVAEANRLGVIGDHLRIELDWSSTSIYPASVTLGVDLVARVRRRPFAPTDIEDCVLWLRGDRGVSYDAGVSEWSDQSNGGNDFRQTTAASRPDIAYRDPDFGARTVLVFDGTDDTLVASSFTISSAAHAFWVLAVDADPPSTGSKTGFGSYGTAIYNSHYPWTTGGVYMGFATATRRTVGNPAQDLTEPHILEVVSTASSYTVTIGDTEEYSGSGDFSWNTSPNIGESQPNGTHWLDGRLAELVIFERELTDDERTLVRAYLSSRYELS